MADEHFDLDDLRRRWLPAPTPVARVHPKLREVAPQRDPFVDVPTLLADLRVRVANDLPAQWLMLAPFLDEVDEALAALARGADDAQRAALKEQATRALWRLEELLEVYYFPVASSVT